VRRATPTPIAFAGAVGISFSAIFFGLSEVDPLTGAFYRMAYAVPVLALLWFRHRSGDLRGRRDRLLAAGAGGLLAIDVIAWHAAIGYIGAGLATLIANSQVVIVPLVTWAVLGERPGPRALWAMPVVMAGLAGITGLGGEAYGSRPVLGVGLAVLAASLYSGFLIVFRYSNRRLSPTPGPLFDATLGAAVTVLVAGAVAGGLELRPSWPGHGWLLALALVSQVAGWLAISYALPRLPASHTSFAIVLQPVLTLTWAAMLFDERPSPVQAAGVALVLAGIALAVTGDTRPGRVSSETSAPAPSG
jgi:drug/metabolite transporter (DMT)-like permease